MRELIAWTIMTGGPLMPKERYGFGGIYDRATVFVKKCVSIPIAYLIIFLIEWDLIDR